MSKSVSLVLGSGGARGYAHIGVIEALEKAALKIQAVVGSSIGALIGGLYANRTLNDYKNWVLTLDFFDVLRLVDFTFSEAGMIKGDRVFDKIAHLLGDVAIEDLPVAYTAVATDLTNHREVWFQRGSLKQAIRASIAIPILFTPVVQGSRILVDGGLLNPLPVVPTVSHQTDLVVAVNVNALQSQQYPAPLPEIEQDKQAKFQNGLNRFLRSVGWAGKQSNQMREMSMFDVMHRSFDAVQRSLSSYKIAGYPPDVMIEIPVDACNFYDFHKAYEMIELGRKVAVQTLDNLSHYATA